jgi:hypothetical protein
MNSSRINVISRIALLLAVMASIAFAAACASEPVNDANTPGAVSPAAAPPSPSPTAAAPVNNPSPAANASPAVSASPKAKTPETK